MKRTFLQRSNAAYEAFAGHIPDPQDLYRAETTLGFVEGLANLAWHAHPGKYADGDAENVLLRIGECLEGLAEPPGLPTHLEPPSSPTDVRRHLLHVATEIYAVGGHTRLIKNWIQSDQTSTHSVVLTRQPAPQVVPSWFAEPIAQSGGRLILLPPHAPRVGKAKWLRKSAEGFDAVILHHHPDDVVPTVAFAIGGLPPVAVLNHADHVFWLGSSVSDMVINLRPSGQLLSQERRMAGRNELLPIPLESSANTYTRQAARRLLRIGDDDVMLLSVGSALKYIPNATHDFYSTGRAILNQHGKAQLFMVGVAPEDAQRYSQGQPHARLHCVGIVEDPSEYYAAADIYLEGFPFGSLTALLEAALQGIAVVLPYGIDSRVLVTDDIAVAEIARAGEEAEYLDQVATLIHDPDRRTELGHRLQDRVRSHHVGNGWQRVLHEIYGQLSQITHQPHLLPPNAFLATRDDVALSKLHETYDDSRSLRFLYHHSSEFSLRVLAQLFFTLPMAASNRLTYKHYRRWAGVMWRHIAPRAQQVD